MSTASRTVVVTGGSGGIGRHIVGRFVAAGDRVVVLDRDRSALDGLHEQGLPSDRVSTRQVDVSDEASVRAGLEGLSRVDVLVNAAAIIRRVDFLEMSLADWRTVLDVNLTGALAMTQVAVPLMPSGGSVVNIASINGERHNPMILAYGVSKAGLLALTKGLAVALAPRGIRVNAVVGGHVLTEFSRSRLENRTEQTKVIHSIPLGRLGAPEDFANAVAFLAGAEAGWVTGTSLNVDGGWLAADPTAIPVS